MRRLFAGVIVTLVLVTLLVLSSSSLTFAHQTTRSTGAAALQAAVSAASQATPIQCSATSCDGWDPYSSGCAYAKAHLVQAVGSVITFSGGRVELWYSDTCQTNWALTYNQTGQFRNFLLAYALRQSDSKHVGSTVVNVTSNGIVISPMLYAPSAKIQACGQVGNPGGLHCTPFI
jgi:hypothetical protein